MKPRLFARYTLSITIALVMLALVLGAALLTQFHFISARVATASEKAFAETLEKELTADALGIVHLISAAAARALHENDREYLGSLLTTGSDLRPAVVFAGFYDTSGKLLHAEGTEAPQRIDGAAGTEPHVSFAGDFLVATTPLRMDEQSVGVLHVGFVREARYPLAESWYDPVALLHEESRAEAMRWTFGLTLLFAFAAVLIARSLAQRMSQPITALAKAAGKLPDNLTSDSSRDTEGVDEVGQLACVLDRMQAQLDETKVSRDFLQTVLYGIQEGLVVTGADGRIQLVNRATAALLGESRDALIGRSFEDLFAFPMRDANAEPTPMSEAMLVRADNQVVLASISRAEFGAGESGGSIIVIRDITEYKRLVRELETYRTHLEQLVAARTRELTAALQELEAFSYSVSHDLHAPLRAINGFGAALREDYGEKLDADGRDYLERMRAATVRMGELIDGLLELSRVVRAELVHEPVDLSAIATEITQTLASAEPDRCVVTHVAPDLMVAGDRRLLRALLHNLLENAWKFTRARSLAEIDVGVTERNGKQVYFVRDNGEGFDTAESSRVFEPFNRLRTDLPGTGIGLATAQRIVQRHGGRLWAEAQPGRGAVFYFLIGGPVTGSPMPASAETG